MNKKVIITALFVVGIALTSCTNDSITETEALIETQSTEGQEGEFDPDAGN